MRIHRVTVTGFGPFRGTETVDFDAFADDGIFLITGRTGAGKTSILDAVTFALFGSVPRYSGQPGDAVRSDFLSADQPCCVELEFTAGDRRFKVVRAPSWERPKQRGTGTTVVPVKAELDELTDGHWQRLQSKAGETSKQINDLIRMNSSQFQQVVLLAQGQFQEFLIADTDKRRSLLQTLFGTKRFADYVKTLGDHAAELRRRVDDDNLALRAKARSFADFAGADDGALQPPADDALGQWCRELITVQTEAFDQANQRELWLLEALGLAKQALAEATDLAGRQRRRTDALQERAHLEERADPIAALKEALQVAQRADLVTGVIESFEEARTNAERAQQAEQDAETGYLAVWSVLPADTAEIAGSIAALNQLMGMLQPQLEVEKSLPGLRRTAETAAAKVHKHDEEADVLRKNRETASRKSAELRDQITRLELSAGILADAKLAAEQAAKRRNAAERAETLSAELGRAKHDDKRATENAAAASERLADLRRRQLAGYAADLAQDLSTGQQCPVCGSLDHPRPATLAADHVDQSVIDEAQSAVDASYAESKRATTQVQRVAERQRLEFAAAGEQSVVEATWDAAAAQAVLNEAADADSRLRSCREQLVTLQRQIDDITVDLDTAHGVREELAATEATTRTALIEAEKTAAEARGTEVSVLARITAARHRLEVGQLLLDAGRGRQLTGERLRAEQARLTRALAQAGFIDPSEAKLARISSTDQQRLRADVSTYEARVSAVELTLESSDLVGLPAELVDVDTPMQTVTTLDAELQIARRTALGIKPRLELLQRLAAEIAEQQKELAVVAHQFAAVDRLASTLRGLPPNTMRMELETFVLAAQLEEIVQVANVRLRSMTDGRYALRHTDAIEKNRGKWGLGLEVSDAHTGGVRTPDSLSGGERFQASLALALGLADVVTSRAGGMRLDTLFIDEGFGSLDAETLEVTMATLDNLREGGRTVGLISHVASMKESIPAQLVVDVVPGGWSIIRQEARL